MRRMMMQLWGLAASWKTWRRAIALMIFSVTSVGIANAYIILRTRDRCYSNMALLPSRDVALVLGANPRSYFFFNRLSAAAKLYKAGRVRHILVSGDNGSKSYDEVTRMKEVLIDHGIPANAITCDYAGFRTLDSVIRARAIFGVNRLIVVSQKFHNYRAVYLAEYLGVDAIAYAAPDAPPAYQPYIEIREALARPVALLDLHVTARRPRFFGKFEPIKLSHAGDRP